MIDLPIYIPLVFGLTVVLTLFFFYQVLNRSTDETIKKRPGIIIAILLAWILLQSFLAYKNFYNTGTKDFPPRFMIAVGPMLLTIVILFITKKGRRFMDSLPLINITWLNIVRIPIEIVLYWLFLNKAVPGLMTFAGRNYDILSGITAPLIVYFCFTKHGIHKNILLLWNIIALCLLINIVANAVLSAPFSFQKFAFDQPNIAVLNFPFILLPAFIVPAVLFGHLVSIRQLLLKNNHV